MSVPIRTNSTTITTVTTTHTTMTITTTRHTTPRRRGQPAVENGRVPSLVFPELVEGRYELYEKETYDVRLTVDVRGGEVTAADWPT